MYEAQVQRVITEYATRPFRVGVTDCATFQADIILAITGRDIAAPWRGMYATTRDGLALLRAAGYRSPQDLLSKIATPVPKLMFMTGDLCYVGNCGGVVIGSNMALLSKQGVRVRPTTKATAVYRITPWPQD